MGNEGDEDSNDLCLDVSDLRVWVLFTLGAACAALYDAKTGDAGRVERALWAGKTLLRLMPAINVALFMAENHRDEFEMNLQEPIRVRRMPD
jgi:hypothetical protein